MLKEEEKLIEELRKLEPLLYDVSKYYCSEHSLKIQWPVGTITIEFFK